MTVQGWGRAAVHSPLAPAVSSTGRNVREVDPDWALALYCHCPKIPGPALPILLLDTAPC